MPKTLREKRVKALVKLLVKTLFVTVPVVSLASPTGIYNCFVSYEGSPNSSPSNGDSTCFNGLFTVDFDRKVVNSSETCARYQGEWSFFTEVVRELSFSQVANTPFAGVTKVTVTYDGTSDSLHFLSVNSGNSLFFQGADFPGSGVCNRP